MKLIVLVLNNIDKLDELMLELSNNGVKGATIIQSTGMAHSLYNNEDSKLINSLKALLDPDQKENRTIFLVVDAQQEKIFFDVVDRVIGDLSKPNTGIVFTVPVGEVKGISK